MDKSDKDVEDRVSLVKAGVGAGIGAIFSAKDIYEARALRTTSSRNFDDSIFHNFSYNTQYFER